MHYKNICHAAGKSYRELLFLCVVSFGFQPCLCAFRMFSPTRRLAFLWTGFSPSTPRESSSRSTPKPIYLRKCSCHSCFFPDRRNDQSDLGFRHLYVLLSVTAISVKWWTTSFRCSETRKQTFPPRTPLASATTGAINSQMVPSRKQRSLSSWKQAEGKPVKSMNSCEDDTTQQHNGHRGGRGSRISTTAVGHTLRPHCGTDLTDKHTTYIHTHTDNCGHSHRHSTNLLRPWKHIVVKMVKKKKIFIFSSTKNALILFRITCTRCFRLDLCKNNNRQM